jgi:UPF0755 protein
MLFNECVVNLPPLLRDDMVKKKSNKTSLSNWKSIGLFLIFIAIGGGIVWLYQIYRNVYKPNITIMGGKETFLYIPTGSEYEELVHSLQKHHFIKDTVSFNWLARKMDYPEHLKPGKYLLKSDMSNRQLITMLRSGTQSPVKLIFHNIRTCAQLASVISKQIEPDSVMLLKMFTSSTEAENYGFTKETFIAMFIPNTYEMYWNTSAETFCNKMLKEYKRFWNENRRKKAEDIGFSPVEVTTIASIVEEETQNTTEKPIIAGVYINRLKKAMALQADPTVKFAVGDFSIRRVLDKHTAINSPYNTYKNEGLPPGPICIPSLTSINAVLNYRRHDYLYFCAKADFSGTHTFAKTIEQHKVNAAAYWKELNRKKIYR